MVVPVPRVRRRLAAALGLAAIAAALGLMASEAVAPSAAATGNRPFRADVRYAWVRAGGTRIAYYERGSGPPLVMLIGTGSTMAEWDPALLRLLARRHRLLMLDYPGVGLSGPWRGPTSFDSLANCTAGLMRAIGLERADVLGWSMGGFVAQRLAIDHPARVSRLVLAGTNPGGRQTVLGNRHFQKIDSEPHPSEGQILRELYPAGHHREGRAFLRRLEDSSQDGEVPDDFHVAAATTDRQVAAEDPWLRSERNWRQLAGIHVPTLATAGARDPVVPPLNLRRIARRIPGARFQRFAGAHAFLFRPAPASPAPSTASYAERRHRG